MDVLDVAASPSGSDGADPQDCLRRRAPCVNVSAHRTTLASTKPTHPSDVWAKPLACTFIGRSQPGRRLHSALCYAVASMSVSA
jgi:hypothetical protein